MERTFATTAAAGTTHGSVVPNSPVCLLKQRASCVEENPALRTPRMLIMLQAMIVLRRSPASFAPWLCVLAFELLNEVLDLLHWHSGELDFSALGGLKDIFNTMLWPTIILLLARYTRVLRRTDK